MLVGHNKREGFLKVSSMLTNKPKTKLLVDGGDPDETQVARGAPRAAPWLEVYARS